MATFKTDSSMTSPLAPPFRVIPVAKACSSFPVGFSLLNHSKRQFVAFYDEQHRITVGSRCLDSEAWTFFKPEGPWLARRNRKGSVVGFDSHNYLTMAVDSMGHLHLSGNMHSDPLIYFRTTKPLEITSLVFVGRMTGVDEGAVTYPRFFRGPGEQFLFRYRDGGSGNGSDYYNLYDPKTRRWSRLVSQSVLDGEGKRNAYAQLPLLGPDDRWHMIYMWRDTWDCETNHDLCYACSSDMIHWERSDGTPTALPITLATGEIVDPSPIHGGLINMSQEIGFDHSHRPVLTYHRYDENGFSQAYAARREEGRWRIRPLSKWTFRWNHQGGGSIIAEVTISPVTRTKDGELAVSYETKDAGAGVWILNEATLEVIETRPPFPTAMPPELSVPRQDLHPEMEVRTTWPEKDFSSGPSVHILRWETLPRNRDLAPKSEPPPTLLEVIELSRPV
jgi:hypothetical protein